MTKDEALKLALNALIECDLAFDECKDYPLTHDAVLSSITAIKEALAQPQQEPVAWQVHPFDYGIGHEGVYARTDRLEQIEAWKRKGWNVQPLFTHPQPKREPLTDEQIDQLVVSELGLDADADTMHDFARAIEAAHGIKENT